MSDNHSTGFKSLDEITVHFGKYKGRHVSVMMADSGYINWLRQQDWFNKKQNSAIYNIIMHQQISSNGPSKTPAHNKMQNLFLEPNTINKLYHHLLSIGYFGYKSEMYNLLSSRGYKYFGDFKPKVTFESKGNWDLFFEFPKYETGEQYPKYHPEKITVHHDVKKRLKSDKNCNEFTRLARESGWRYTKPYVRSDFETIYYLFMENLLEEPELHIELDPLNSVNNIKSHFTRTKVEHLSNSKIESKRWSLNGHQFFQQRKIDENKIKNELFDKYKEIISTCLGCGKRECIDGLYLDWYGPPDIKCELKPSLSDDYPEVLRKMRDQIQMDRNYPEVFGKMRKDRDESQYLLIVEKFTSDVCSIDQLGVIFKQHNITVLLLQDFLKERISYFAPPPPPDLQPKPNTPPRTSPEHKKPRTNPNTAPATDGVFFNHLPISRDKEPAQDASSEAESSGSVNTDSSKSEAQPNQQSQRAKAASTQGLSHRNRPQETTNIASSRASRKITDFFVAQPTNSVPKRKYSSFVNSQSSHSESEPESTSMYDLFANIQD